MGMKLGEIIGEVCETVVYEMPNRSIIVKVKISIHNPIKFGLYIGSKESGVSWVDFRCEKLHMFNFLCGIIGHNEDHCKNLITPNHGVK